MEVNDELAVLRRALPAAIDAIARRRPRGRRGLPLPRGPPGQAGLHRRHPQRGPARPALRARGVRAGPAARDPRRPRRPTSTRSTRTRAPPPSGCARSNESAPTEEPHDEQSRLPDPLAGPPDRRGGGGARPPHAWCPRRRVRAARVPFVTLVSLLLLGGVVGLLLFNTSMQQASFAATSLEGQASTLDAPASRRCAWSSTCCATRSGWPSRPRSRAWSPGRVPVADRPAPRTILTTAGPATVPTPGAAAAPAAAEGPGDPRPGPPRGCRRGRRRGRSRPARARPPATRGRRDR